MVNKAWAIPDERKTYEIFKSYYDADDIEHSIDALLGDFNSFIGESDRRRTEFSEWERWQWFYAYRAICHCGLFVPMARVRFFNSNYNHIHRGQIFND
jgi:hypothetical protein